MSETKAAFWIAYGGNYAEEARHSAASLAQHHPDCDRYLFTSDNARPGQEFAKCVKLPPRQSQFWYLDATRFFVLAYKQLGGYHKLAYFDTDTHVCQPLDGLWQMLDRFDFVGAYAPGRSTQNTVEELPNAFPEINIGVLGLRPCERVTVLLDDWFDRYHQHQAIYKDNDQAPLREALWHNYGGVRLGILPVEYNLRFGFGNAFRGSVKVLHGRPQGNSYEDVCRKVNDMPPYKFRAWRPGEL